MGSFPETYNDLISSFHSLLCRRLFWGELLYVNLLVIQEITSHFCLSQDVLSYRAVGISVSRIFTINHRVRSGTYTAFLYLSWYLDFYSQLWPKALSRQTSSWWKTNNAGEKVSVDWLNHKALFINIGWKKSNCILNIWHHYRENYFFLLGYTTGFDLQCEKLELHTEYIVLCESTAEEVSFEW